MGDVRLGPVRMEAERMGSAGRQGWGFSQKVALGRGVMCLERGLQAPGKGKCPCAQAVAGLEDTSGMGAQLLCLPAGGRALGGARGVTVFGFGFWAVKGERDCAGLCGGE